MYVTVYYSPQLHLLIASCHQYLNAYQKMIPYLNSRESQLCQEFAFFPTAPPHSEGGIFELRKYQLKAGTLLEWEHAWYVLHCWVSQSMSGFKHACTLLCSAGEEALRLAGSSSHPSVLGSHRLDGSTRCITCGSIRALALCYAVDTIV